MTRLGINRHFNEIFDIAAGDFDPKPSAGSFARLIETYGIVPKRAVFLDDMPRNLKPAADLGMTTVLISTHSEWAQPTGDEDYIHHTTERLADWLTALGTTSKKTGS
jgi:putative hydrolase of the HAD superfamily